MHSDTLNIGQIMRQVIYALALGIAAYFYFFGWGVLIQILIAIIVALIVEAVFLKLRGLPVKSNISDGSAILTAVLLAISIPSIAPYWIIILGVSFAIIFGKQLYGGLGNNPFNPAMLGYVFLLISYPLQMTTWQSDFLSLNQSLDVIFNSTTFDGISSATRLDSVKTQVSLGKFISEISFGYSFELWVNIGFLLGGIYLLIRRVIFWHIPGAFLLGLAVTSTILFVTNNDIYPSPIFHLTAGATMLGAFFIATDPVSAATTPKGRLVYGFLGGMLVIIIRTFGGYPDGVAFAVLLMNITVPLIDYYTQPRIFGK